MVGDHDVMARVRDVLAPRDLESEAQLEERDPDQANEAIGKVRAWADRKEVGGREGGTGCRHAAESIPLEATTPGIGCSCRASP